MEMSRKELKGVFALIPLVVRENQEIDYEGFNWIPALVCSP
jgi:hypothetical protein